MPSKETKRLIVLAVLVVLTGLSYGRRLIMLQIVEGESFLARQQRTIVQTQPIKAARGEIVDRDGRALAYNSVENDVLFDMALAPLSIDNEVIFSLIKILRRSGESWNDSLPLRVFGETAVFDGEAADIALLKGKKYLDLNSYASAEEAFYWLCRRYKLEEYAPGDARAIAGVRYEMEKSGYSMTLRYVFAKNVTLETAIIIRQSRDSLPGVDVVERAVRGYPDGALAPHIVGRTGPIFAEELDYYLETQRGYTLEDLVGKEGIEKAFEDVLRGTDGLRSIELDSSYRVVELKEQKPAVPGKTVVLTVDSDIQRAAAQALQSQILSLNENAKEGEGREADAGAVVAIDIKNSEVLAAVTLPSYSLSSYTPDYAENASNPLHPFLNRAFSGVYAPGSCFKPVVAAAGLASDVITPDSRVNCQRVYSYFANYQPTCLSYHGPFAVVDALRESCNIFFYDTGRLLGIDAVNKMAASLGLGVLAGIELNEAPGTQTDAATAKPGDALQVAIGQLDNGYTPLQLANFAATLARNGELRRVKLIKSVSSYFDWQDVEQRYESEVIDKIDAPENVFETVRQGMVAATHDVRGTAYRFLGDYPYLVASKTGTPQTRDFPNSTFICYAPADDPQIAVAVVIEKGWHGYTGAPVARAVMDEYFAKYAAAPPG
jgi:penicillin-binding protein 2